VLKWISLQLGHASIAVTERHYAAYMAMDSYQNPWMVPEGCLPPDLFTTLDGCAGLMRASAGLITSKPSKKKGNNAYPPIWYISTRPDASGRAPPSSIMAVRSSE